MDYQQFWRGNPDADGPQLPGGYVSTMQGISITEQEEGEYKHYLKYIYICDLIIHRRDMKYNNGLDLTELLFYEPAVWVDHIRIYYIYIYILNRRT